MCWEVILMVNSAQYTIVATITRKMALNHDFILKYWKPLSCLNYLDQEIRINN